MTQQIYWHAPIWEVVLLTLITLLIIGWMQATDNYVIGKTYWQIIWRNDKQYTRSVPIVSGSIQWSQASSWTETTSQENLPGSGTVQTQANYIFP